MTTTPMRLAFHAISDVGRVRKDNQDSGYAGPWLLAVCDGVGGAARGDIASGTAITELKSLDVEPTGDDLRDRVNQGIHEAHLAIGRHVDHDPALSGTSTTATVAGFDGTHIAVGHVGDSRAYLYRDGELSQLTTDHTFVQSLIDDGRITEEEARSHPNRNLILKALDGVHEVDPDVFTLELVAGDRLFLCSDGACGVLTDDRMADILSHGSPEYAAIELVRTSLDAGSSDNVTCIVADVVGTDSADGADSAGGADDAEDAGDGDGPDDDTPAPTAATAAVPTVPASEPMIVGAAADPKRRMPRGLFRGHRSGDTGEMEPIEDEIPEGVDWVIRADPPVDPEALRYAPRARPRFAWARRILIGVIALGIVWIIAASGYWWTQQQYYVAESDGQVAIYRGVDGLPGTSSLYRMTDLTVDDLPQGAAGDVREGIAADGFEGAVNTVHNLAELVEADE